MSHDPTVRGFYAQTEALLVAGIAYAYPDLDVDELRNMWQDNDFESTISKWSEDLRALRDWMDCPSEYQ